MQDICSHLQELVREVVSDCTSDCIALSGGLDSAILAFCLNKPLKGIAVIAKDFPSTDLVYSQLVAKQLGLELFVKTVSIEELLSSISNIVAILKVFNPIEIRNAIVMYLAIEMAKNLGQKSIMTGDGADELFAGYNFFQRMTYEELQKDLERIWKIMHFPTQKIGQALGVKIESPFLDERIVKYSKSIPADLKIHEENGKKYGKWILRKAFQKTLPDSIIWREKSPMQDGAGTSGLTFFFENLIADSIYNEKMQLYHEKEKVLLASKESLYYYEIYRKNFEPPALIGTSKSRCPQCNGVIEIGSHFCRLCGSFPI